MTTTTISQVVATAVHARSGGWCEAHVREVCTGFGQQLHHVVLRSRGGRHTLGNLRDLCSACHTWVHANPAAATERGLMRSTEPKE